MSPNHWQPITIKPIGIIHSSFKKKEDTPIQPAFAGQARGQIVVFNDYAKGLVDIEGFSHIEIIYYFHEAGDHVLTQKPFLDDAQHGVFATRHPDRPSHIGISVVRLLALKGATLEVEGIDVLDGTPLLDIKPYVPGFGAPGPIRLGWLQDKVD
jgi:tRNA-Thr(GGU) m(6)t(6)A37 methyltransferase TsaA